MYIFHKGDQMSHHVEENCKKSNSAQETSAEGNVSPAKDCSITQKQLVRVLQYHFIIKILKIALNFFHKPKTKQLESIGKYQ